MRTDGSSQNPGNEWGSPSPRAAWTSCLARGAWILCLVTTLAAVVAHVSAGLGFSVILFVTSWGSTVVAFEIHQGSVLLECTRFASVETANQYRSDQSYWGLETSAGPTFGWRRMSKVYVAAIDGPASVSGWAAWCPAFAVMVFTVPSLAVGVWWRVRHRGKRGHCGSCGYDLHGLDRSRCPECGTGFGLTKSAHGESTKSRSDGQD